MDSGSKVRFDADLGDRWIGELQKARSTLPDRVDVNPETVENGLARVVLTVIELLRRLMEHEALRRMEGGSLSDAEIERLGATFMRLDEKMDELKRIFRLTDDDLNLDLGPLGNLL